MDILVSSHYATVRGIHRDHDDALFGRGLCCDPDLGNNTLTRGGKEKNRMMSIVFAHSLFILVLEGRLFAQD
jgi:hypothetical protein